MKVSDAEVVVFKKSKRFAPDFHRHILTSKVVGQVVRAGDSVLVYSVEETIPDGAVLVTPQTHLEFR
ncbi:MAG TPA: hypothetical protein VE134_04480 [Methanomicrobiales archaeon]|nr:hypothetical protein [Methanomicrobiales archaeon]